MSCSVAPLARCGAAAILRDDDKRPGSSGSSSPTRPSERPIPDPAYDLEREIEELPRRPRGDAARNCTSASRRRRLHPRARLGNGAGRGGDSWARPITLKYAYDRRLGDTGVWPGLGLSDLTTFLAVRTRLERDGVTVERSCVLRADPGRGAGGPGPARAARAARNVEDVLRYLALLLKDPGIDDVATAILEATNDGPADDGPGSGGWVDDLVLLEPLVRAFARDDDSLDRVEHLLEDLRDDNGRVAAPGTGVRVAVARRLRGREAR